MPNPEVPRRTAVRIAVSAAAGLVGTAALGSGSAQAAPRTGVPARATATPKAADCSDLDPDLPKRQLRGDWIASVDNIDWPSEPGLSVERQKAELTALYDEASRRGLNAVFVQVRPTADAFWPSRLEPWSQWLTGTQGEHPGYDPLAYAVAEAHKRNLELHAWFNPYRVTLKGVDPSVLVPEHPARKHPDWVLPYGGKLYYNPGLPAVRAFVQDAIMDAVERYDVDGVHFDDYFYPYPVEGEVFDDAEAFEEYGGDFDDLGDWRRNNTDLLIQELAARIRETKPWVRFGVSPFGVWRNRSTDPEGSDTQAGAQTYDDLYADTRRWVREQWIDYILPQVYWQIGHPLADYAKIVPWWAEQARGTDVALWVGQASYKVADPAQPAEWQDPEEMSRHLLFNRKHPEVSGDVYFSAKDVTANRLDHVGLVQARHYSRPALVPVIPRLGGKTPKAPVLVSVRRTPGGVEVRWVDPGAVRPTDARTTAYAVYRIEGGSGGSGGRVDPCELADARNLIANPRASHGPQQRFTDTTAEPDKRYTYLVTALNRRHLESRPSAAHPLAT